MCHFEEKCTTEPAKGHQLFDELFAELFDKLLDELFDELFDDLFDELFDELSVRSFHKLLAERLDLEFRDELIEQYFKVGYNHADCLLLLHDIDHQRKYSNLTNGGSHS